jgi:hypothetical protein
LTWGVITGALINPANAAVTAEPSALLQQNLIRHHDGEAGQCCSNSYRVENNVRAARCYCCGQQRENESCS